MKKMLALMVVGGMFAVGAIGCGPAASTGGTTTVTTDKDKTKVETKDKNKADVKVDDKGNVEVKKDKEKEAPKP